jgi:hypothetical protein
MTVRPDIDVRVHSERPWWAKVLSVGWRQGRGLSCGLKDEGRGRCAVQDVTAGGPDGAPPEELRSAGTAALESLTHDLLNEFAGI